MIRVHWSCSSCGRTADTWPRAGVLPRPALLPGPRGVLPTALVLSWLLQGLHRTAGAIPHPAFPWQLVCRAQHAGCSGALRSSVRCFFRKVCGCAVGLQKVLQDQIQPVAGQLCSLGPTSPGWAGCDLCSLFRKEPWLDELRPRPCNEGPFTCGRGRGVRTQLPDCQRLLEELTYSACF